MHPEYQQVGQVIHQQAAPSDAEAQLVAALRRGDEAAFVTLLDQYQNALLRLARLYVASNSVAEEVVQETWLAVLTGIDRFEGRSSLRTWIFRILANRARTRGVREGRSLPFSAFEHPDEAGNEPAVDPARFQSLDDPHPGHWNSHPGDWQAIPEERLLAQEVRAQLQAAIAALPAAQQTVITLRDVEGWSSDEVCNVLGVSDTNQRVLLHRARSKVRRTLAAYFAESLA